MYDRISAYIPYECIYTVYKCKYLYTIHTIHTALYTLYTLVYIPKAFHFCICIPQVLPRPSTHDSEQSEGHTVGHCMIECGKGSVMGVGVGVGGEGHVGRGLSFYTPYTPYTLYTIYTLYPLLTLSLPYTLV
jgi:hypothetical protein